MHLRVQRAFGNESFNVGLPIGDSMGLLVIDGIGGNISGLGTIAGASLDQRSDAVTGSFLSSNPADIVINVTPNSIHVTCDNTTLVDWTGDPSTLEVRKQFWKVDKPKLFFGSWESEFIIRSATIRKQQSGSH
ncbi:hypothetical protein KOR42_49910 [Thalassoglobus neptunius]|uniref:Uncharacterized protein n=1 Tax=Thalassoglobus neptunius TaxID=1938619 RepID=A0A5C5VN58_9PLAN|nr:hypothetical protein [Thalassoglobus neptunius]TWT40096.1 hypothetical protein KOR42_49910 [Thalassoglobus neptunius]